MIKGELMKNPLLMAAATLLTLGLAHTGSAQGQQGQGAPPAAPTITTLAGDVQADWAIHKEWLVNAADAMPADKFGYKSTPAQRSYGEQIMHVVGVNQQVVGMLGGKTPAPAINLKAATKAEVTTALRQSISRLQSVMLRSALAALRGRERRRRARTALLHAHAAGPRRAGHRQRQGR